MGAISRRWTIQFNSLWFLFWIRIWNMRFWDLCTNQQTRVWTFPKHKNTNLRMKIKPLFSGTLFHKACLENQHFSVPPPHFLELYLLTFLKKICNSVSMAKLGQLCWNPLDLFLFRQQNHPLHAVSSLCQHCRIGTSPSIGQWSMFCHAKAGVWPLPLTGKLTNCQTTITGNEPATLQLASNSRHILNVSVGSLSLL